MKKKHRKRRQPISGPEGQGLWARRAKGEPTSRAARALGLSKGAALRLVSLHGGIRPKPPKKARLALTAEDREEITRGLAAHQSFREIGRRIRRPASTISREVARNGGRQKYRAATAERMAPIRARRPKPTKLALCERLRVAVEEGLKRDLSPKQIEGFLKDTYPEDAEMRVSAETIYVSLYVQGRGTLRKELVKHLRQGHTIRQPKKRLPRTQGHIKDMVNISQRPAEANDRAVPGHWEGDLLLGNPTNAIGVLVERKTRFVILFKLPSGINAESARLGLTQAILTLPESLRRSLTWDQGREMKQHLTFTLDTGMQVYFCDPASPWQRGTAENTNGLLRQYFPRNKSVAGYTQEQLDEVALRLNQRPRQTLGWKPPAYRLAEILGTLSVAGVALTL